ncbi:MAG TPA: hypothetical protein GXX38_06175 [Clostridia bacterium]|nr:hypothetical protein [Clostridia bacterium]
MLKKAEHPLTFIIWSGMFFLQTLVYKHPTYVILMFLVLLILGLLVASARLKKSIKLYLYFGLAVLLLNPFLNKMGSTSLFKIGKLSLTLESISYGFFGGLSLVTLLLIFTLLNSLIAPDRLINYLFRSASRTSMIITIAFSSLADFQKRVLEIKQVLTLRGMFKEKKGIACWFKDNVTLFKVVILCGLEDSIHIAASMECRGYGMHKRSNYEKYSFNYADFFMLGLCLFQLILLIWALVIGLGSYQYYPRMQPIYLTVRERIHCWLWLLTLGGFVLGEVGDILCSLVDCKE